MTFFIAKRDVKIEADNIWIRGSYKMHNILTSTLESFY